MQTHVYGYIASMMNGGSVLFSLKSINKSLVVVVVIRVAVVVLIIVSLKCPLHMLSKGVAFW